MTMQTKEDRTTRRSMTSLQNILELKHLRCPGFRGYFTQSGGHVLIAVIGKPQGRASFMDPFSPLGVRPVTKDADQVPE